MKKNIFLVGFMGTGKSAVGESLSALLGLPLVDMDKQIEEDANMAISSIFKEKGEGYFRELEAITLKGLCNGKPKIISCGGGLPLREENRSLMTSAGVVVWLTATAETIYDRVKGDSSRPLLQGHMDLEYIKRMMNERNPMYETAADLEICTEGKTVTDICHDIAIKLKKT